MGEIWRFLNLTAKVGLIFSEIKPVAPLFSEKETKETKYRSLVSSSSSHSFSNRSTLGRSFSRTRDENDDEEDGT